MFGLDYHADLDPIFTAPDGNYRKSDSVSWAACDIARRAGLEEVGLHALRHTTRQPYLPPVCRSRLSRNGRGTGDSHTTAKIYQHALPDSHQDVAATWDRLMAEKAQKSSRHNLAQLQREIQP